MFGQNGFEYNGPVHMSARHILCRGKRREKVIALGYLSKNRIYNRQVKKSLIFQNVYTPFLEEILPAIKEEIMLFDSHTFCLPSQQTLCECVFILSWFNARGSKCRDQTHSRFCRFTLNQKNGSLIDVVGRYLFLSPPHGDRRHQDVLGDLNPFPRGPSSAPG